MGVEPTFPRDPKIQANGLYQLDDRVVPVQALSEEVVYPLLVELTLAITTSFIMTSLLQQTESPINTL